MAWPTATGHQKDFERVRQMAPHWEKGWDSEMVSKKERC